LVGARDLAHRTTGVLAAVRGAFRRAPPDDDTLAERVRARLGRVVSHPHAIAVAAERGRVVLSGDVLKAEHRQLLRGVRSVSGVAAVDDRLHVHHSAGDVPMLQGGHGRPRERIEFMQQNWAPGPRIVALGSGSALAF
jgi:hypothetical protein